MMKKFYSLFIALLIVCSLFAQNKKVVVVGTTFFDTDGTTPLKDGETVAAITAKGGYDVTTIEVTVADASILTECNAADVVILGRSINSSNMGSAMAIYDQITAPVINMNMWGMRNLADKALWVNNAECINYNADLTTADAILQANILVADDVFAGLTGTVDWWVGYYSAFGPDLEGDDAGNGVLLAETADRTPLFIRWTAGVEYFTGAGHSPASARTFIGCGQDNVATDIRYFTFTDNAKTIFFNELARMAGGSGSAVTDMAAKAAKLSVYAANGEISLSMDKLSRVEIYSLDGKLVLKSNANGDTMKMNPSLHNGIYIARAFSQNGQSASARFSVR